MSVIFIWLSRQRVAKQLPVPFDPGAIKEFALTDVDAVTVTVLVSSVTAPLRASNWPLTVALVVAVIEVKARIVPSKCEDMPRVAEVPTCQNTFAACAPFIRTTLLLAAVIKVDAAWKMNTALGSPWASNVSVPVMPKVPAAEL